MPARRLARAAVLLAVLAPLACATTADRQARQAEREAALAGVPANAPAGVFAAGTWRGTLRGELPMQAVTNWSWPGGNATRLPGSGARVTRDFDVEVHAWRDSARMALAFASGMSQSPRTARHFPQRLAVAGDTMSFTMPYLLGYRDARCRLVLGRRGTWDGPCRTPDGERVARLTLAIPRAGDAVAPAGTAADE